jgi:hypothetical protein
MRRAIVFTAALALAGCKLDYEGARCNTPGSVAECPSGQACGNDGRCSERAAACGTALCVAGRVVCSGNTVTTCTTSEDAVCGSWHASPCAANTTCTAEGPTAAYCRCDANAGLELAVDPSSGSTVGAQPFPTGLATPPECRFKRVGDALASAADLVAADPAKAPVVTVMGGAAGRTVSLGSGASGEVLPLVVPQNTTLTGETASGATYEIVLDDAAAAAAVTLSSAAALSHLTIRNAAAGAAAQAVTLLCSAPAAAILDTVTILGDSGAQRLGHGLFVGPTDSCGLSASAVDVSGAGIGLEVDAATPTDVVEFTGGSIRGCGKGVRLRRGVLMMSGTRVEQNTGFGVSGGESDGDSELYLANVVISTNGDTGLRVLNNRKLSVTGSTIYGNGATTSWAGATASRRAGGIVLWGNPPAVGSFLFTGNRVYANKGDQVLALSSGATTWNVDGTSCAAGQFSVFACYDADAASPTYRGLVALDAHVQARDASWDNGVPTATSDFAALGSSASVDATGTGGMQYCPQAAVSCSTPP